VPVVGGQQVDVWIRSRCATSWPSWKSSPGAGEEGDGEYCLTYSIFLAWNPSVLNLLPSQQLRLPTSFFLPSNNDAEPGCLYGEIVRCFGGVEGKPLPDQGKTLHQFGRSSGSESGLAATIGSTGRGNRGVVIGHVIRKSRGPLTPR
jgi:hypothetical protein